MAPIRFCLAVVALTGAAACGPALTLAPPPESAALDYRDELAAWTRSERLYNSFETELVVHVTALSARFVAAWLQEYRQLYSPTPEQVREVTDQLFARGRDNACFFMAAFTGERDWNDFALSNSVWSIELHTSQGTFAKASTVTQVKSGDLLWIHFFPYFERFFEGYVVCFPERSPQDAPDTAARPALLNASVRWFTLKLSSPVGQVELRWDLDE